VSPSMGNSDGCDPESCDHVVITNCTFNALDDTIAIKSGRDADGRRLHTPSQNIVIAHCRFASNDGMITCGSELSGGIQNVYAYDLTTFGKSVKYVLYVKSNSRRGGFAKNINIDTVHGSGVFGPIIFIIMNYNGQTGSFLPDFSGPFTLNNVVINKAPQLLNLTGLPNDKIGPLVLSNSTYTGIASTTNHIVDASTITYTNVTVNGTPVH
ncbi:MAG: hypothetical protein JO011_19140, partial [Ktedonobacteraceae bacterium]|nr:hypothetical protein [Ktedonobacteraceae bacterium]